MWVQVPPAALFMPRPKLPEKDFEWDANLAYVVGLLTTDGCLSKDKRHITMRSSDHQLLRTFQESLGLTNRICETNSDDLSKKQMYTLQFGDVQLYGWLEKIGLSPAKTYTIGKIDVPDKYFPDFLRGELDGDGSVYTYIDDYNSYKGKEYTYKRLYTKFISVSEDHMKWLKERIKILREIEGNLYKEKPSGKGKVPRWTLRFAKKKSIKLLSWMYYDSDVPCLTHKRKIAEEFI